jgi:hypothetical protein
MRASGVARQFLTTGDDDHPVILVILVILVHFSHFSSF